MLYVAHLYATEHQKDLLREAEAERRANLVRGARGSAWTLFLGRLGGLLRRLTGAWRAGTRFARPAGPRPATS